LTDELQLEAKLKGINIPPIEVHDQVMRKIREKSSTSKTLKTNKVLLFIALGVILLCACGFGTLKVIELLNAQNEKVLTLRALDNANPQSPLSEQEREQIMKTLSPGQTVAVLSHVNNPHNIVTTISKPFELKQFIEMETKVGKRYYVPESYPSDFEFIKGTVQYNNSHPDLQEIYAQKEANPDQLVTQQLELLRDEIVNASFHFMRGPEDYIVSLLDGAAWNVIYTSQLTNTKIVELAGTEGIIKVAEGRKVLMWNNGEVFYQVSTSDISDDSDMHVLSILESFIPK